MRAMRTRHYGRTQPPFTSSHRRAPVIRRLNHIWWNSKAPLWLWKCFQKWEALTRTSMNIQYIISQAENSIHCYHFPLNITITKRWLTHYVHVHTILQLFVCTVIKATVQVRRIHTHCRCRIPLWSECEEQHAEVAYTLQMMFTCVNELLYSLLLWVSIRTI